MDHGLNLVIGQIAKAITFSAITPYLYIKGFDWLVVLHDLQASVYGLFLGIEIRIDVSHPNGLDATGGDGGVLFDFSNYDGGLTPNPPADDTDSGSSDSGIPTSYRKGSVEVTVARLDDEIGRAHV